MNTILEEIRRHRASPDGGGKGFQSSGLVHLLALVMLALIAGASGPVLAASISDFQARIHTNAVLGKLPYRIFIPKNYQSTAKYPLVLFLHGSGQRGTDNGSQFQVASPLVFVSRINQTNYPCFMVAPQSPPTHDWLQDVMVEAVLEMLTGSRRSSASTLIGCTSQGFRAEALERGH